VHHDISAGNVLRSSSGIVIIDWEAAEPFKASDPGCMHYGLFEGTPGFAAPERSCSPLRDVFSCAALFVKWVTRYK
jgi:serine/threonine protein kinase